MTSTFSVNIEHVHVQPWGCVSVFADCSFLDGRKLSLCYLIWEFWIKGMLESFWEDRSLRKEANKSYFFNS